MTNLFVVIDESASVAQNSLPELLKDAGVDYLDLRAEDATIPTLQPRDGPNWLIVNEFPEDLQGASTVWIGEGTPAQAATFNIDSTEKTVTQIINEVNGLVDKTVQDELTPEQTTSLYAVWPESTEEGMLALTPSGELIMTREPTEAHPDPLLMKETLRAWQARIQKALDEPDRAADPETKTEDDAEMTPAPVRLKYLNHRMPQDDQEDKQ